MACNKAPSMHHKLKRSVSTSLILSELVVAGVLQQLERRAFKSVAEVRGIAQDGQCKVGVADQTTSRS